MSQDADSMGTGRELFAVCSPFGNPTIRGSLATLPLQSRCVQTTRGAIPTMLNRFAMLASVCVAIPVAAAPLAQADPPPPADPAVAPIDPTNPLPPEGRVPSGL